MRAVGAAWIFAGSGCSPEAVGSSAAAGGGAGGSLSGGAVGGGGSTGETGGAPAARGGATSAGATSAGATSAGPTSGGEASGGEASGGEASGGATPAGGSTATAGQSTAGSGAGGTPAGTCSGSACDCKLVNRVELTNEIALLPEAAVHRAGSQFTLSALDPSARWWALSTASWQGDLAAKRFQSDVLELLFGAAPVSNGAGADETSLLVFDRGGRASTAGLMGLRASQWRTSQGTPLGENVFMDADYFGQVVTFDAQTSSDGRRALFVYGNRLVDFPTITEFGPDGLPVAPPLALTLKSKDWGALQIVPTATGGTVSAIARPEGTSDYFLHLAELDAVGALTFEAAVPLASVEQVSNQLVFRITPAANEYIAWLPYSNLPKVFLRIRRDRSPDARPERWDLDPELIPGIIDLAALEDGFIFLRSDAGHLVVERADAAGQPFATPLTLSDAPANSPVSVFAVEQRSAYVSFLTNANKRVIAQVDCPAAP